MPDLFIGEQNEGIVITRTNSYKNWDLNGDRIMVRRRIGSG